MPKEEYKRLQEALRKSPTPEARREAAQRFREFQRAEVALGRKRSRPKLVSLGLGKSYPTTIALEDIPAEIERNPAFFDHLREIMNEED